MADPAHSRSAVMSFPAVAIHPPAPMMLNNETDAKQEAKQTVTQQTRHRC